MKDICSHWQTTGELGPFYIDYSYVYTCTFQENQVLTGVILLLWVIYLINALGSTASNYFSPTLGSICEKIKIPYDIAGVTLLAFGNGAPDVFTSISSFTGGVDILIALSSLLGGSVFVATVVVGSIAIVSPCEVSSKIFIRDISFHFLAATAMLTIAILGKVTVAIASSFFILYFLYVTTVLIISIIESRANNNQNSDIAMVTMTAGIQTAFWNQPPKPKVPSIPDPMESFNSLGNSNTSGGGGGGYKFLILDQEDEDEEIGNSSSSSGSNNNHSHGDARKKDPKDITINISGGMGGFTSEFNSEIFDDYFGQEHLPPPPLPTYSSSRSSSFNQYPPDALSLSLSLDSSTHLTESLLGDCNGGPGVVYQTQNPADLDDYDRGVSFDATAESLSSSNFTSSSRSRILRRSPPSALTALYWRNKMFQNKMHRRFFGPDWWEYPIYTQILTLSELPLTLSRDLTIPTTEEATWNKTFATCQPLLSPLFFSFISGTFTSPILGKLPVSAFGVLLGLPISGLIHFFTHHQKPPSNKLFLVVWNSFAFIMSISWIYTLAKELVTCLASAGTIYGISPAFLGLTVLAWGNSTGDFFSNIAVANNGFGKMAVAGCYAGPVFNILIGMGISLCYVCWEQHPKPYLISFDKSSLLSLAFLYIALITTAVLVALNEFKLQKFVGIYLISLYILYTVCQFILVWQGD